MIAQPYDFRFIQTAQSVSAADALSVYSGYVPAGKIWTIRAFGYSCNVAETRTLRLLLLSQSGQAFPLYRSESGATSNGIPWTPFSIGDSLDVFQGERIRVSRDAATAGSTMTLDLLLAEIDFPYFEYVDPIKKLITRRTDRIAAISSGSMAGPGSPAGGSRAGGGRTPGSEPI